MHVVRPTALRALAAAALVAAVGLIAAPPASAHNVVVGTVPVAGSTVTALPTEVVLNFEEPPVAGGTAIVVKDPQGQVVTSGATSLNEASATVELQPLTLAGKYSVSYRSASDDGHTITGSFAFTVPASLLPDATPIASPSDSPTPSPTATDPASPSASPAASTDSGSGSGPLPFILGGLAVGVVAGLVIVLVRRRSA
ncbi:MAG: copper resistance protein CopC [Candidatus Nanopelagicales bacterium]